MTNKKIKKIVANAETGLAVDSESGMTIVNGNLYYFVSNDRREYLKR